MFVIPTPKRTHCTDLAPIVLLKARSVNGKLCNCPFICFLDSSSTGCIQNKCSLPYGTQTTTTHHKTIQTTTQGTHSSDQVVFINNIQIPEFVNQRHVEGTIGHIFESPHCPYDIIIGQDFLQVIGIKMDFHTNTIQWLDT